MTKIQTTIKEMGNIEVHDLGETCRTIQCPSCLKKTKEGTVFFLCERTEKIKNRIGIISNPLHIIKEGHTGERHVPTQWQHDHWKAKDATIAVKKRDFESIEHRWLADPQY